MQAYIEPRAPRLRFAFGMMAVLLGLMATLPGTAAGASTGCKLLTLSGPAEYPPLSWGEGDRLEGAGYDLARLAAHHAGIATRVVPVGSWPRTYARIAAGEVDMAVALYRTAQRERALIYLPAWSHENTLVIMNRQSAFPFKRWEDLIGHPGATSRGDSGGDRFDRFARDRLTLVQTPTQANMFAMLAAGRVDYIVVGEYSPYAPKFNNPASDFVVAPMPIDAHLVHMAMSRKSPCAFLVPKLSAALAALVADGTAARLVARYSHNYARGR